MRTSTASFCLALAAGTQAVTGFVAPATHLSTAASLSSDTRSPLRMSFVEEGVEEVASRAAALKSEVSEVPVVDSAVEEVPIVSAPRKPVQPYSSYSRGSSQALPWTNRPLSLNSVALVGDFGFDPLGLAGQSKERLLFMREAEIRHARISMIAAVGWPLSELWNSKLSAAFSQPSIISANGGLSPSVLNGGLDKVSPVYWAGVLAMAAAIELYGMKVKADTDPSRYVPGDLGFDPFGYLISATDKQKEDMQLKELKNGRLAMMGITLFALEEFLAKTAVVSETPIFFEPVWKILGDYYSSVNSYLQ